MSIVMPGIEYFITLAKEHAQLQAALEAIAALENPDGCYELRYATQLAENALSVVTTAAEDV